jgi:hypothetical protein
MKTEWDADVNLRGENTKTTGKAHKFYWFVRRLVCI